KKPAGYFRLPTAVRSALERSEATPPLQGCFLACPLALRRRGGGQSLQALAGQVSFVRIGVALDQRTKLSRARLRLTQIEQGVSLLQLGRGQLVACRIAVQAFVIFIDRFGVVFLSVVG